MMTFRSACIYLILLLLALGVFSPVPVIAQNHESATAAYPTSTRMQAKVSTSRLLTVDQGLAVLGAALESRVHDDAGSDCSHLVHAIYERAGFPYPYASSSSLYTGTEEEFHRVTRPQPGDLVVWPGHAGIIVNPAQHTFFSALRSGHGVEAYDSAYWNERGHAHFFRYVNEAGLANQTSAVNGNASLKTATSSGVQPASRNASFDASEEPQMQLHSPRSIVSTAAVPSAHPTAADVTAALAQMLNASGDSLQGSELLNPAKPAIVFDQLSVGRVRLGHDYGWAEIHLTGTLRISSKKMNSTKHDETLRWPLARRDHDRWEITLPSDAVYISTDLAVRALAHELATLTDEPSTGAGASEEKVRISRLLNLSLENH